MKPSTGQVPRHVGIILDGNRRFSKRLMIKPWKGHEWGVKKLEQLFDWCVELGIKEVTIYGFSLENFDRPKIEFEHIMKIFRENFAKLLTDPRIDENQIHVNFIGRIKKFPKDIYELMLKNMERSKKYHNYTINFAMAYSGRAEIVDATKRLIEEEKKGKLSIKDINERVFSEYLDMASEPDLIIRTSESRLSGFLLYQGSYAEIIFLPDKLWPEFEKEDFISCINEYKRRKRRYGR